MKQILVTVAAIVGVTASVAPARAALLKWDVDYSGFFAEDATIDGFFIADESAALDGIVSGDEFESWEWNWSGNSEVAAFSLTSAEGAIDDFFGVPGFYVDGTPNEVNLADGLEQGVYSSDNFSVDLEFLIVEDLTTGSPIDGVASVGDLDAAGSIVLSDPEVVANPEVVPEPGIVIGLLALAGVATIAKRTKYFV